MCGFTNLLEKHEDKGGAFYTTPLFWDCDCEENYIHPASEAVCFACNTRRENACDARMSEIFLHAFAFSLPSALVNTLAAAAEEVDPNLTASLAIPF